MCTLQCNFNRTIAIALLRIVSPIDPSIVTIHAQSTRRVRSSRGGFIVIIIIRWLR